jgi:hypothetical protein
MSRSKLYPVALSGVLAVTGSTLAQAGDCSGSEGYDYIEDCPACGPASYRPKIKVVVRRPRINIGALAPAAPPQNVVVQQSGGTTGGAVGAPAFGYPVMMMAAPAMAFTAPQGTTGGATGGATGGSALSDEDILRICRLSRSLNEGGATGAVGSTKSNCAPAAGGAVGSAGSGSVDTCQDLRQMRKDVDELAVQITGLTRAVEVLVDKVNKLNPPQ